MNRHQVGAIEVGDRVYYAGSMWEVVRIIRTPHGGVYDVEIETTTRSGERAGRTLGRDMLLQLCLTEEDARGAQ